MTITSSSAVTGSLLLNALRTMATTLGLLLLTLMPLSGKGRRRGTGAAAAPMEAYARPPNARSDCRGAGAAATASAQPQREPDLRASARRRRWCRMVVVGDGAGGVGFSIKR